MRAPKGFNPGHLNVAVRLLKRTVNTGEGGFQTTEYAPFGPVRYAEWNDAGARDIGLWQDNTTAGVQHDARLIMRHVPGIDNTIRLKRVRDESLWAVVNVKNYFGGNAYMELAIQRADEGGVPIGY